MEVKEKELFKALCKFKSADFDEQLVKYASPNVLGHLFFNRVQGIAYGTLKERKLLGKVTREFRNSLAAAYEQIAKKNDSFMKCVDMISEILMECDFPIAMPKGAYLCAHYPKGYRTSNDIDLLVMPSDVTKIGDLLSKSGFEQGNIRNGEFVRATRREIIESKMMRGETVPYVKEVNLPFMKFLEVDINFSLDYKNGNGDILSEMLSCTCLRKENGLSIPTLNPVDFFIHLCAHLYKEATTLPWVEMKRDMTLYKYCDIYLLLSEMANEFIKDVFTRAEALGMEKICAYAVSETMDLFDMGNAELKNKIARCFENDEDFQLKVTSPKEKKIYKYNTKSASERFFMKDRAQDLKEIMDYENT